MVRVIEIGKKGPYTGKKLFEILCNLRSLGVGRIVERISQVEKATEGPNFYRIVKVAPQMDADLAFGSAWAEQIRGGKKVPFLIKLNTSLPDYRLVMRHDESKYTDREYPVLGESADDDMHLKRNYYVPPIMAEFLNRHQLGNKVGVYRHGIDAKVDGYDQQTLATHKIPHVYEFDEYDAIRRKVYEEN